MIRQQPLEGQAGLGPPPCTNLFPRRRRHRKQKGVCLMNCPYCGKEMESGYLSSRSPVFWSEDVSGFPIPTQQTAALLGKALGLLRPRAYLCRVCRKVVVDY